MGQLAGASSLRSITSLQTEYVYTGAGAYGVNTWVQLTASTTVDVVVTHVAGYLTNTPSQGAFVSIDFAWGASGSETTFATVRAWSPSAQNYSIYQPVFGRDLTFPVYVPTGTRMAARVTGAQSTQSQWSYVLTSLPTSGLRAL